VLAGLWREIQKGLGREREMDEIVAFERRMKASFIHLDVTVPTVAKRAVKVWIGVLAEDWFDNPPLFDTVLAFDTLLTKKCRENHGDSNPL